MNEYRIGSLAIDRDDPGFQSALAEAYAAKVRPRCACQDPGIDMYIAKMAGHYVIKRMPDSGSDHHMSCDSYEPPAELSGLAEVMGSAIQENPDDGVTALKLDFSLTKSAGRAAPIPAEAVADSVRTDGTKLTLRGTLHYLWEEAGFNRWTPAMSGKRSWYVIRKYLLQAAEGKVTKRSGLAQLMYIPESFNASNKEEITQRRMTLMAKIGASDKGTRHLMLVIGEVKEIAPSRYGHKIVLRHLPDCHFMMNADLHQRLCKRFDAELTLWDAVAEAHLMLIGTFAVSGAGVATLEEVALIVVTDNWIPFEHLYDKLLLDTLTREGRRFVKGLRYNLPASRPVAAVVLSDCQPQAYALYVTSPDAGDDYHAQLQVLMAESQLASWEWRVGNGEMPKLPLRGSVSP